MGDETRRNVIVVGAGASSEFGLPTGAELKKRLQRDLRFNTDAFGIVNSSSGDASLRSAIHNFAQREGKNPGYYFDLCRTISDNMVLAPSIDNFLDTHKSQEDLVFMGKLSISNAITRAERESSLKIAEGNIHNRINFGNVQETWTAVFFKLIAAKRDFESFMRAISNITFVSFNYDRCIKQFFVNAASSYFNLQPQQVEEVLRAIEVIHPYGSIGELAVVGKTTSDFGLECYPEHVLRGAKRINTFTEGASDPELKSKIEETFGQAQVLIFLGFSFIDINMEILQTKMCQAERILATAMGRSEDTRSRLANELRHYAYRHDVSRVELFDGKCFELFYEFDHYLMASQP